MDDAAPVDLVGWDPKYQSPATRDLHERRAALREAQQRLLAASAILSERGQQASPSVRARLEAEVAAASEAERRAADAEKFSLARHPVSVYQRIASESQAVKAPKLSAFQWWAQNPGFLTSVAKNEEQRDEEARRDYLLTRLNEEASQAKYPFSLYDEDATAGEAMAAAEYAGRPEIQAAVRSPYRYFLAGDDPLSGAASIGERAGLAAANAVSQAIGPEQSWASIGLDVLSRPQHFATGFRAAGQRLAEGNPYGAAMGVGQAFLGPLVPELAVDPAELQKYASPTASTAINMALDPTWYYGSGASKAVDRLRYGRGVPAFLEDASGNAIRRLQNAPGGKMGPLLLR